jgi:hypothetical protein
MNLQAPGKKEKKLPPITPNHATESTYSAALEREVRTMAKSYLWWLSNRYETAVEENADAGRIPDLAQDAAPKTAQSRLLAELGRLQKHWEGHFKNVAKRLAARWVGQSYKDNANAWKAQMRRAGFTVDMQLSPAQRSVLDVAVSENVSLITSIPAQFATDVHGIVLRSFLAGRDLHTMADALRKRGGVTVDRAALIAHDQSNKLTAAMNAGRQRELGLQWAVWKHSSAGKEPRPNHVKAGREEWIFDTQAGIDFGDAFGQVLPGVAINCRCGSRTLIPAIGRNLASGKVFDPDKLEPVPGFPGAYRQRD